MKEIQLTKGKVALIDDEDFERINKYKWWCLKNGYALRTTWPTGKIYMHREIMGFPNGFDVDHKDGNPLNNQKSNLRVCAHHLNLANRKLQSNNTSGYRGVIVYKSKWKASVKFRGKTIGLGIFETIEDAARAYDKKARELFGEFARLNFPET